MELYLVRHGETIWNQEGRYYGHADVPLAENGRIQAEKLGRYLKTISFDKVYCSPLQRATDTAVCLTDQPLILEENLKEQNFGLFEGKTYQELQKEYGAELEQWNASFEEYCLPQGESFRMVRHRVDQFTETLWKEQGRILIVAHKGTFGHMLASLLRLPLSGYWNFVFEQGTYSKIDLQDGYAILRALNRYPEMK